MSAATLSPYAVATQVSRTIDAVSLVVDEWRDRLAELLAAERHPDAATLDDAVAAFAVPAVESGGLMTGAGFVAAPGLLSDAHWHLAWWLAGSDGPRRLATVDDPSSDQFRDYTALEWWRFPARTGTRHLTGPYVDYVCTDDYTVTITTPVSLDGELLGVAGTDLLVDRLERELLPIMRSGEVASTLVNASGRIVTSTDPAREPGSILRMEGMSAALGRRASDTDAVLPAGVGITACGDSSLFLVTGV